MQVNFYSEKLVFYKFYLLTLMLIFIILRDFFFKELPKAIYFALNAFMSGICFCSVFQSV